MNAAEKYFYVLILILEETVNNDHQELRLTDDKTLLSQPLFETRIAFERD